MARVTNKLADQNLKDIAIDKYEKKKISRIPTEIVDLVSQGKVYPKSHPLSSGELEMRYMTAYDEDILTSPTYVAKGIAIDKLLESLIVSDIDLKDITVADKNGLIIDARILSYGKMYPVQVTTPEGDTIKTEVDLSKLDIIPITLESDENGEFDYRINETHNIKFRYPPSSDDTKKTSDFLNYVITQINESRDKNDIAEFIKYDFRVSDSKKFQTYFYDNAAKLDLSADIEYTNKEGNQETFRAGFQIGADLFWF
jgi:hypothetical protein